MNQDFASALGYPPWLIRAIKAPRTPEHRTGARGNLNRRKRPTAPTRNCGHLENEQTPSSKRGGSSPGYAAAPGAQARSPRRSSSFNLTRPKQDEKGSRTVSGSILRRSPISLGVYPSRAQAITWRYRGGSERTALSMACLASHESISVVHPTCTKHRPAAGARGLERSRAGSGQTIRPTMFPQFTDTNSLMIVGGQGQDRTVDLPLFRSTALSAVQTCENGRH